MIITEVRTTLLQVPYAEPFRWAQGTTDGATVVLVEIVSDEGIVGVAESVAGGLGAWAVEAFMRAAATTFVGKSPFANARLIAEAYQLLFRAYGSGGARRFSGQVLAGLEMALWDLVGKALGRPVHELLGGAVRDSVEYFGFAHGSTPAEIADDARRLVDDGFGMVYVKVGFDDRLDVDTVAAVRDAVGPDVRLRVDANERWTPDRAAAAIARLNAYDIEVVEQPTPCESVAALAQVRSRSPVAIAADQVVQNSFDAFDVCRMQAADLIVVGVHETGGITGLLKVAAVAESAGLNVCLHGQYETGITTCTANQAAAVIDNLDDGNQHMQRFLAWDIVSSPALTPVGGRLPVITGAGLGFELDQDNVSRAREAFLAIER